MTPIWLARMPISATWTIASAPATSNLCGEAPQASMTIERSTTASPTVTSTTESTGSPSIGRMISRSTSRPSTVPATKAIATVPRPPAPSVTTIDHEQ